jgi:hypothetical protein
VLETLWTLRSSSKSATSLMQVGVQIYYWQMNTPFLTGAYLVPLVGTKCRPVLIETPTGYMWLEVQSILEEVSTRDRREDWDRDETWSYGRALIVSEDRGCSWECPIDYEFRPRVETWGTFRRFLLKNDRKYSELRLARPCYSFPVIWGNEKLLESSSRSANILYFLPISSYGGPNCRPVCDLNTTLSL